MDTDSVTFVDDEDYHVAVIEITDKQYEQYANEAKEAGLDPLEYSKVELVTQNDKTFSDSVSLRS